jgi:hypothetical protein
MLDLSTLIVVYFMMMANSRAMIMTIREIGMEGLIILIVGGTPDTRWWLLTVETI